MDRSDLATMSDRDIENAISMLQAERSSRALDKGDVDQIIQNVFETGFNLMGDPVPPKDMGNGIVAITSMVKDTSAVKHRCHLYTIKDHLESPDEFWIWEEGNSSFLASETTKVDKIRKTVSIHAPSDDAVLLQHTMVWDGSFHDRKAVRGYTIKHHADKSGEIKKTEIIPMSNVIVRKLPAPSNKEGF